MSVLSARCAARDPPSRRAWGDRDRVSRRAARPCSVCRAVTSSAGAANGTCTGTTIRKPTGAVSTCESMPRIDRCRCAGLTHADVLRATHPCRGGPFTEGRTRERAHRARKSWCVEGPRRRRIHRAKPSAPVNARPRRPAGTWGTYGPCVSGELGQINPLPSGARGHAEQDGSGQAKNQAPASLPTGTRHPREQTEGGRIHGESVDRSVRTGRRGRPGTGHERAEHGDRCPLYGIGCPQRPGETGPGVTTGGAGRTEMRAAP